MRLPTKPSHTPACTPTLPIRLAMAIEVAITSLAVFSAVLLFRFKLNSAWLVAIGALLGLIAHLAP